MTQEYRGAYEGRMDANEFRKNQYGALEVFQKQSKGPGAILSADDVKMAQNSFGNVAKIPVLDARDVTIGSVRSCIIPPDQNNSKFIVLTFVTYVFGFTMIPSMYKNNDVKFALDYGKKLRSYLLKLLSTLDAAGIGKLEMEKNRVFTGLTVEYPVLGNALQVPKASRDDFYNQLKAIFSTANFVAGEYDIVANPMHQSVVAKINANGSNNADNTAFQMAGYDEHFSSNIIPGTGIRDVIYGIPEDTVFMVNRNTPDEIAGESINGGGSVWGEEYLEDLDMTVGTFYTEQCTDATAIFPTKETEGLTRTKMMGFSYGTDVCFIAAYNSDPTTRQSPIMKAEIAA
jgi:hypothetical protein